MTVTITAEAFVERLRSLDRETLARLRRGEPAAIGQLLADVEPEHWIVYEMVACLFPLNPYWEGEGNMGTVMRTLTLRYPDSKHMFERRFAGLLDTQSLSKLQRPLAHSVRRAAMKGIAIDWVRLVDDLSHWEEQPRLIAREWAREFWGDRSPITKKGTS